MDPSKLKAKHQQLVADRDGASRALADLRGKVIQLEATVNFFNGQIHAVGNLIAEEEPEAKQPEVKQPAAKQAKTK